MRLIGSWLFVTTVLFLSGCSTNPRQYTTWTPPVADGTAVSIELILVDNQQQLSEKCGRRMGKPSKLFLGCAVKLLRSPDATPACVVYGIVPESRDDVPRLAVIGHELLHCYGAEHE